MYICFIEDENGEYLSVDKNRKFKKYCGNEAYLFLKSNKRRLMRISDIEDMDEIYLELPKDKIKIARKDERHEQ